jgi:transcriptional regulator with XRE-family HTH domain/tetratricopeptide (TPR) repeat protein
VPGQVHPGTLVRAWRERALLTQEQLAERAGLSARTIGRLESGGTGRLRPSSLELLATALGLTDAERSTLVAAARATAEAEVGRSPPDDVPRQLPAPLPGFTGRRAEIAAVDRLVDASAVVVASIDGMAGVGKTAFAVQVAHRLAEHFPDGQLFVDLHGSTDGVAPVRPDGALASVLRALGLPDERIPQGLDDRAALYRSRLAGRKVLILLDDAANEAQVVPLIPGTPGCMVLVTSRLRLPGLDSTHAFSLDVLPRRDAVVLFTRVTEDPSIAPELLAEVVELCDRLPLAIRIAAARLRARPAWTAAHLIDRLRDHRRRLGELEAGLRSVTAALDLSYRQLARPERRAFRLLGLHPGGDLDAHGAAALIGCSPGEAEGLIGGLLDAHLIQEPTPGRYRFHDLVRAYAAAGEPEPDRAEALTRLLDHCCRTASAAMDLLHPYERERRPPAHPTDAPTPALPDEAAARAWLDAELANLLAAAHLAADRNRPGHLRHLSTTLHRHLRTLQRHADAAALHERALTLARARGERRGEAEALLCTGHVERLVGRSDRAVGRYRAALAAARACGHRTVELDALVFLGHMDRFRGRYETARARFTEVLTIAPGTGHHAAQAEALVGLGFVRLESEHDVDDEF